MNSNLRALKEACRLLNLTVQSPHATENCLIVNIKKEEKIIKYPFVNWNTPLNPQSVATLCQDKDYFYCLYRQCIKMPESISFLNPYCHEKYHQYLKASSLYDIINQVEAQFNYPVIVKKNRGSLGIHVYRVDHRQALEQALMSIFNQRDHSYDYVVIIQEWVPIQKEYRAVFWQGELQLAYQKVIDQAQFTGNLSPLHWSGAYAELVRDDVELRALREFVRPLFNVLMIPFCGLDIILDQHDQLWLLEANSSPGFDAIIKSGYEDEIIALYQRILTSLPTAIST